MAAVPPPVQVITASRFTHFASCSFNFSKHDHTLDLLLLIVSQVSLARRSPRYRGQWAEPPDSHTSADVRDVTAVASTHVHMKQAVCPDMMDPGQETRGLDPVWKKNRVRVATRVAMPIFKTNIL